MEIAVSFEMKSESRVRKYFKQSAKDFLGEEWDELYPEGVENYTGFENAAEHDPGFTFESSWNRAARDIFQSKIIDRSVGDLDSKKELKAILEESIFDAHHVGYSDHNSDLITGDLFLFGFWASEELGDQGKRIILKVTIKTES